MRAGPERPTLRCWQCGGSGRRTQQLLAHGQQRLTFAIGEEAKVSDADETSGQYMLDKTAEELGRRQSHFAVLVAVRVVLPTECDALSVECEESVIGDGNAMGVAAEIAKNVLRPAEGRFGINDPILAEQSAQECGEPFRISQRFEWTIQAQFMLAIEPAEA